MALRAQANSKGRVRTGSIGGLSGVPGQLFGQVFGFTGLRGGLTNSLKGSVSAGAVLAGSLSHIAVPATPIAPISTAATGLVADGDSITFGAGGSPSYPDQLATITGLPAINLGVSGRRLSAMLSAYDTNAGPQYNASTANTLVLLGGINDIMQVDATSSDLQALVQAYAVKAKASGFNLVVGTLLPTLSVTSPQDAQRQAYNTWLRANYSAFAKALIDFDSNSVLQQTSNAYVYADGLHPTAKGNAVMAEAARLAMGLALVSDTTPDAFSFTARDDASTSQEYTSEEVQITGLSTGAAISISGGSYSINNGSFVTASGTILPYDKVRARLTSADTGPTAVTATLTIGGMDGAYVVTTVEQSVFSPSDLFAVGEAGVWLDPSDLTTLFQDTAGAVPVTADGQSVQRINDKSGNGNHLLNSVSAWSPTYKTSGGLHWLEFDGADDFLQAAFAISQPWERVSAIRHITFGGRLFAGGPSDINGQLLSLSSPNIEMYNGVEGPVTNQISTGVDHVVAERADGVSSQISVDGGAFVAGNSGTSGIAGLTIANTSSGSGNANMRLYGLILRAGAMSADQMTRAKAYMAGKAGI